MRIRCADVSERATLTELHRRSSYVWEEDRAALDAHPEVFGVDPQALADGRVRVAVGAGGALLGFVTVAPRPDGALELEDLFVEPQLMRRGIGRGLVRDAQARAGGRRMTVLAGTRTVPFYERLGFVAGEAAQTRFGPAVRMWWEPGSASDGR
ncbi:MAG TPA: GNAT family N-acetyltransferase [Conexibacter sp.]|nr:GNAT family N-acetyltransferase [Conexibacter sp.]